MPKLNCSSRSSGDDARQRIQFDSRVRPEAFKPKHGDLHRCGTPSRASSLTLAKAGVGFSFVQNRAAPDANAAITGAQSRPVSANPAGLKTSPRSICVTMAATVRHGGVTPVGVWLVASEPKASKSYEARPKATTVQSDSNSNTGLLSANEPNRNNINSIMTSDSNSIIAEVHRVFCSLTGTSPNLRLWERDFFEFVQAGFTAADMEQVLIWIMRENKKASDPRYRKSTSLMKLIGDLRFFDAHLCEARAANRNRQPPTAKTRALNELRPLMGEPLVKDQSRHVSEIIKIPKE